MSVLSSVFFLTIFGHFIRWQKGRIFWSNITGSPEAMTTCSTTTQSYYSTEWGGIISNLWSCSHCSVPMVLWLWFRQLAHKLQELQHSQSHDHHLQPSLPDSISRVMYIYSHVKAPAAFCPSAAWGLVLHSAQPPTPCCTHLWYSPAHVITCLPILHHTFLPIFCVDPPHAALASWPACLGHNFSCVGTQFQRRKQVHMDSCLLSCRGHVSPHLTTYVVST